jgi:DNA excision repair protein ERCC-2
MDPARQLSDVTHACHASVMFSATLTPHGYFHRLLGCRDDAHLVSMPSPFPEDRLGVVSVRHISTLYRDREKTREEVSRVLHAVAAARPGNYLMYFPSYAYMDQVYDLFRHDASSHVQLIRQEPEMAEDDRHRFLAHFDTVNGNPTIGFAVLGGIFGEGIDLVGDRLTGAVIVGVGLPGVSTEQELIRRYFDALDGSGFDYAYRYPGINRVLQAAGRVIRTASDRGVIVLVDRRYATAAYNDLLPARWQTRRVGSDAGLQEALAGFWKGE